MDWKEKRVVLWSTASAPSAVAEMKAAWTHLFGVDCPSTTKSVGVLAEEGATHWLFKSQSKFGVAITLRGEPKSPTGAEISLVPATAMPS